MTVRQQGEDAHAETTPEQEPLAAPPPHSAHSHPARCKGGASAPSSVATLINCAVGAPVLSLPFAYQQTGWAAGIALTVAVAALEAFTLVTLARHAERTASPTYSALVRSMLGAVASVALSLVTIAFAFGSCCAYLIILADCVQPLLEGVTGESSSGAWWAQRECIILLLGTGVMLPLSFPDSLDALAGVSSLALAGLIAIVGAVAFNTLPLLHSPQYAWRDVAPLRFGPGFLASLPILVYGFQSHTNVVSVFYELEDEPVLLPSAPSLHTLASCASLSTLSQPWAKGDQPLQPGDEEEKLCTELAACASLGSMRPAPAAAGQAQAAGDDWPATPRQTAHTSSTKLRGMKNVVCAAVGITAALYCLLGVFGYLGFGKMPIGSNILDMYPASDAAIQVARVMLALIQLVSYPINLLPARAAMWHLLEAVARSKVQLRGFHVLSTLGLYSGTLAVALSTTDLGLMFQLIGGTCGAVLIFGMPGALLMSHAQQRHAHSSERLNQDVQQQSALLAPAPADPEAGHAQHPGSGTAAPPAAAAAAPLSMPGWLASKQWWCGLALVLLTAFLCGYTLREVLRP